MTTCESCYKYGRCWACVKWFGCHKEAPGKDCFVCDKMYCKEKENAEDTTG